MKRPEFDSYIKENDFSSLFNQLGWNNAESVNPVVIGVEEERFKLECVAQRNGFKVYVCEVEYIPLMSVIKCIDKRLRKSSNDYILIFISTSEKLHHEWIVPVKAIDKRILVPVEYTTTSQADFLYSKHLDLSFDLEEETTILDVTKRVQTAFEVNSEKVTKDFYAGFKKQHNQFADFISGINVEGDKQWYVSVMLNRLMFCYFIQKKNFLDFNPNYLRDKLNECKAKKGKDKFFKSFYKSFLIQLFQGGLNSPKHETDEFKQTFGRIPYLNGGMFDQHQLEKQYAEIDIADEAFENLFDFFDKYRWHLDTRIEASGKDINPDVLGYIFEQYINDRAQMGAYYTKEDITNYIGKNCILPFLWDKTLSSTGTDSNSVWDYLKNSGDTYIYDAVKHGLKDENGKLKELPENIANGLDTTKPNLIERRKDWNTATQEDFALPTEIWRETVERRTRYIELCEKISSGKIKTINDFITYNLDIVRFTQDYLQITNNMKQVLDFYHAMQNVTILDPTCGSGAFLFAAMNILEPLYDICLDRMEEVSDNTAIKAELDEIKNNYRSNRAYYIYKSIILKNLYGVDIMNEATEIAKLRLFLKMVAVVEADKKLPNLGLDPLPDIDFNIRCGNTLVGFATENEVLENFTDLFERAEWEAKIKKQVQDVSANYKVFHEWQLKQSESTQDFKTAKANLILSLTKLNDMLNKRLFEKSYSNQTYDDWLKKTQPFHWFAEFYEIIIGNGGFDVIIGNPPYVVYSERTSNYKVQNYESAECKDLYAFVIERCLNIKNLKSSLGMIVPISIVSTDGFLSLRKLLYKKTEELYFSNYAMRPSKLFEGAEKHLSIFIARCGKKANKLFTSQYQRWSSLERSILFEKIDYCNIDEKVLYMNSIPKISSRIGLSALIKIIRDSKMELSESDLSNYVVYHTRKLRYFVQFLDCAPIIYNEDGSIRETSELKKLYYESEDDKYSAIATYLSTLFFWFFISFSDCRNLNKREVCSFPFELKKYDDKTNLYKLGKEIVKNLQDNSFYTTANYKEYGKLSMQTFQPRLSKIVADKIDTLLAKHYGFTEEELDFIINYDIKYRMGNELEEE